MELDTYYYQPDKGWNKVFNNQLDSNQTLIIVFGNPHPSDIEFPLAELIKKFPSSQLIGCSTAGEIHQTQLLDNGLSVAVVKFEHSSINIASAPISDASSSFHAGETLATELHDEALKAVLVLSEGLTINGSELIRGLNSVLSDQTIITGGLAADSDRFEQTWVIVDEKPLPGYVTAVGLYGDQLEIGYGSKGGWDRFGVERKITRSEGNVLYELDNHPALALYKEYLGERASGLPATGLLFPLALRQDESDQESVVRTILAVNEDDQSITFAGDIPQDSMATLMYANFDRLIDGASDAATMIGSEKHQNPSLTIAISCVGRRLVLGERAEEEIEATLDVLPGNTHQIGFYSYGEISPHASGQCDLHNQTMTLTTISER